MKSQYLKCQNFIFSAKIRQDLKNPSKIVHFKQTPARLPSRIAPIT